MQVIKFILTILETLNSELVERGEAKTAQNLAISNQVKNGVRLYGIQCIIQTLGGIILNNF